MNDAARMSMECQERLRDSDPPVMTFGAVSLRGRRAWSFARSSSATAVAPFRRLVIAIDGAGFFHNALPVDQAYHLLLVAL